MAEKAGKTAGVEAEGNRSREKVCKRCKQIYDSASNNSNSCRFHPSFFVCRRHDDQKRYHLSVLALYFLFFCLIVSFTDQNLISFIY
uniref:Putative ovule protein n=1 Tax=Solanum chacoense TaxID=4108 RepID=A0A0V0GKB6_SOLCH